MSKSDKLWLIGDLLVLLGDGVDGDFGDPFSTSEWLFSFDGDSGVPFASASNEFSLHSTASLW